MPLTQIRTHISKVLAQLLTQIDFGYSLAHTLPFLPILMVYSKPTHTSTRIPHSNLSPLRPTPRLFLPQYFTLLAIPHSHLPSDSYPSFFFLHYRLSILLHLTFVVPHTRTVSFSAYWSQFQFVISALSCSLPNYATDRKSVV